MYEAMHTGMTRGTNHLQKNMHEQSFSNIICDLSFDYHHVQLKSCACLSLGA
jgi:hypothetical protein